MYIHVPFQHLKNLINILNFAEDDMCTEEVNEMRKKVELYPETYICDAVLCHVGRGRPPASKLLYPF